MNFEALASVRDINPVFFNFFASLINALVFLLFMQRECDFCSKLIEVRPYKIKLHKNFFCNINCKSKWMSKNLKGKNNPRTGKRLSDETKKLISEATKGKTPWNKGKRMSEELIQKNRVGHFGQPAWNKKETFAKCDGCGKIFHKKLCNLKKDHNHFCNINCKSKWMSKNLKGKNNPFYENHSRLGQERSIEVRKKIQATHLSNVKADPEKYRLNGYKAWKVARESFRKNKGNGKYTYKKINMRSSWEVLVAEWLDKQDLTWSYESVVLDCGKLGKYHPDFYIKEWDKYIEVKGFWQEIGIQKFNFWKNKAPNQFILFDRKALEKIGVL